MVIYLGSRQCNGRMCSEVTKFSLQCGKRGKLLQNPSLTLIIQIFFSWFKIDLNCEIHTYILIVLYFHFYLPRQSVAYGPRVLSPQCLFTQWGGGHLQQVTILWRVQVLVSLIEKIQQTHQQGLDYTPRECVCKCVILKRHNHMVWFLLSVQWNKARFYILTNQPIQHTYTISFNLFLVFYLLKKVRKRTVPSFIQGQKLLNILGRNTTFTLRLPYFYLNFIKKTLYWPEYMETWSRHTQNMFLHR